MWDTIANIVGTIGVLLILIAFYLVQNQKMLTESMSYYAINCIGGLMILFSLYFFWNVSSVIMEIAWITISILGMIRIAKKNTNGSSSS